MSNRDNDQAGDDASSASAASRHSSIRGPYRQTQSQNTFARCNLVSTVAGSEETYSRSLLTAGNGFAFWDISGSASRSEKHQEKGVSLGDVGILDPDGEFVFGFNIFAPATDPLNIDNHPEGFEEIHPPLDRDSEVRFTPDYFSRGSIIASKGVDAKQVSEDPLEVSFSTMAREGALLILPDGASREDLISTSRLTEYIKQHALDWYQYMCHHAQSSASMIPNGSLYLITGCDKAKSWSVVSIPRQRSDSGKRIEMTYRSKQRFPWLSNMARTKTLLLEEGKGKDFTVFGRGIRISLSNRLWMRHLPYHPPEEAAYYNLLSTPILGFRSRLVRLKELLLGESEIYLEGRQKFPFHPSIIISQILLDESPSADVAVVEDSVWCNLVDGGEGTLPQILSLLAKVIVSSDFVTTDGLVTLVPKKMTPATPIPSNGFFRDLIANRPDKQARYLALQKVAKIIQLR